MNARRFARTAAVAATLTAGMALSSCGFDAQTNQVYNPGVGVNDRTGSIDVLGAVIVSGSDGSGTLVVSFANNSADRDDTLTGVSGEGVEAEVSGATTIPGNDSLNLSEDGIRLTGDEIAAGRFVPLTFSFERAEAVSIEVPVVANEDEYADVPVD